MILQIASSEQQKQKIRCILTKRLPCKSSTYYSETKEYNNWLCLNQYSSYVGFKASTYTVAM